MSAHPVPEPPTTTTSAPWVAVIPVKRLALAKTRLHLADAGRQDLAMAFAVDTVRAVLAAASIDRVIVVTDDRRARKRFDDEFGGSVHVVPDVPDAGLNTALMHGAHTARELVPACHVLAVSADLPALQSTDVDEFIAAAHTASADEGALACFLSDASGIGTTMLTAHAGSPLNPEFGRRSRAAHRGSGIREIALAAPGARRDVDTLIDLWDAQRLGVGAATAAVLATIPVTL